MFVARAHADGRDLLGFERRFGAEPAPRIAGSSAQQFRQIVEELERVGPADIGEQPEDDHQERTPNIVFKNRAVVGEVASDHPHDDRAGERLIVVALSGSGAEQKPMQRIEDYNMTRPHSSQAYQTRTAYAEKFAATGWLAMPLRGSACQPYAINAQPDIQTPVTLKTAG